MRSVYLNLLRLETRRVEESRGLAGVEEFLSECAQSFKAADFRVVVLLERAKLRLLSADWEECLNLLDEVQLHDHLLEPPDKAVYYLTSARLHHGYGDINQAIAFIEMALAESSGRVEIEAQIEMGSLFNRIGERERGSEFLSLAEEALREQPSPELESRLAFERGLEQLRSERISESLEAFERSLRSLNTVQPSAAHAESLRFLGIIAAMDSRPLEALELQKKALDLFLSLNNPFGASKTYSSIGQTCLQLERYEEAELFLRKAEEICRTIGAEAERAMILGKLGSVFVRHGDFEKAISYQKQDLELSSRFGNYRALAFSLRNLGLSYKAMGDLSKAVGYLRDSRDRFAELEDDTYLVKADLDLVGALLDHDRVMEAFGYLEEAQEHLDRRLEISLDHVNARFYSGVVALRTNHFHRAESLLWQALEMCQSFSLVSRQAHIHERLAELYLKKNDREAAQIEYLSVYRLAVENGLSELRLRAAQQLLDIDPDALFQELLLPS